MRISILTLFPQMFEGPFKYSIIDKAIKNKLISINLVDIRDYGIGKHKEVDDKTYGGGKGMVMRVDVIHKALQATLDDKSKNQKIYILSARGKTFNQKIAKSLSKLDHLILICGHYEGIDERIDDYIDGYISVGDYITTGGEIPAMLITDSVVRLVNNVLSNEATENESFSLKSNSNSILLEHPQYTTPSEYNNKKVPDILLSGDHKKIDNYRRDQSLKITKKYRPDLINTKVEED